MMGENLRKKAQQEMVGFILIIVLVVVAMMIFLVISVRNSGSEEVKSVETDDLLNAILKHTTNCAIVFEPQYDSFEDLFKSCHKNDRCSNLNDEPACDYLESSMTDLLKEVFKTESTVTGYELTAFVKDDPANPELAISEGDCTNKAVAGSQRNLVAGSDSLLIRLKVCKGV